MARRTQCSRAELKGKIAVANAKMAYQFYKTMIASPRWKKLAAKGAMPQRLLWASTSTKNKAYSDVLYVETLIGADTVNTMPPETMDAWRDHGTARDTIDEGISDAEAELKALEKAGISLDAITVDLVVDGVEKFAEAADKLYGGAGREARQDSERNAAPAYRSLWRVRREGGGCRHRRLDAGRQHAQAVGTRQIGVDERR